MSANDIITICNTEPLRVPTGGDPNKPIGFKNLIIIIITEEFIIMINAQWAVGKMVLNTTG